MNYYDKQKRNAFKSIKDNHIILDLTNCKYPTEVHLILKEKFVLPEYYGENWDALLDCLDDRFLGTTKYDVSICGYATMTKELRDYCAAMLEIFDDVHKEHPKVTFKMIS